MINLGYFIAAGQDVVELHVSDIDAALDFYDAHDVAVRVDDRVRVAHILHSGSYFLLMETLKQ